MLSGDTFFFFFSKSCQISKIIAAIQGVFKCCQMSQVLAAIQSPSFSSCQFPYFDCLAATSCEFLSATNFSFKLPISCLRLPSVTSCKILRISSLLLQVTNFLSSIACLRLTSSCHFPDFKFLTVSDFFKLPFSCFRVSDCERLLLPDFEFLALRDFFFKLSIS